MAATQKAKNQTAEQYASDKALADAAQRRLTQQQEDWLGAERGRVKTAEEGVAAIDQQKEADIKTLRQDMSGALLASRGSSAAPSGARLAAMRATAVDSTNAQSKLLADAARRRVEAEGVVADARGQLAAKEKEIDDQRAEAAAAGAQAANDVRKIIDDESGTIFTTDADRRDMVKRVKSEVLPRYRNNPAALEAIYEWIRQIESGNLDVNWSFDV